MKTKEQYYGAGEKTAAKNDESKLRDTMFIYKAARAHMGLIGVAPMDKPEIPAPTEPGKYKNNNQTVLMETNVHGLKFGKKILVHRYHMDISYQLKGGSLLGSSPHLSDEENGNGNGNGNGKNGSSSDINGNGSSNGNGNGNGDHSSDPISGSSSPSPDNGDSEISGEAENEEETSSDSKSVQKTDSDHKMLKSVTSKRIRGDPGSLHLRDCIRKVYLELFEMNPTVFTGDPNGYYFDLASTLYTIHKLPIRREHTFYLETKPDFFPDVKMVVVYLKETDNITVGDFTVPDTKTDGITNLKLDIDYPLIQFLEIATNQTPLFNPADFTCFSSGKTYLNDPKKFSFSKQDYIELPNGTFIGIGSQKSVRLVEGPKGRGYMNCGVVVENKKTPFHKALTLADKAYEAGVVDEQCCIKPNYSEKQLNALLAGLYVENKFKEEKDNDILTFREPFFRINRIDSRETPTSKTFIVGDRTVSLVEYYRTIKNVELQYPFSPIAEAKFAGRIFSYPLEALVLVEHQRVATDKQTPEMISKLIKTSAILPYMTSQQIEKNFNALGLSKNLYMKEVDTDVMPASLKVPARLLEHPKLVYGNNQNAKANDVGSWNVPFPYSHFLIPSGCKKWVLTFIHDGRVNDRDTQCAAEFVQRMIQLAGSRGMSLPEPANMGTVRNTPSDLKERFEKMVNNGADFAFFITMDRVKNMHDFIKLFECQYEIVTQDLNARTMENVVVKGQRLTLENILMKTNVKLGGLNHTISIDVPEFKEMIQTDVLYVGFGMNHPAGGMRSVEDMEAQKGTTHSDLPPPPPTVVGFSANDGKNPFEFIGDYVYQPARRDEKVMLYGRDEASGDTKPILQEIFETILKRFKANRGSSPSKIIIYRNGCSEGQFANVLCYEVPIVKHAMKLEGCEAANLTFIVPNRLHNLRLYPAMIDQSLKAPLQNIKPGYVIDTAVTNPNFREFYLCSHATLQGTSKVPRYTVLYTDDNLTSDQIQQATYALAYGHQIVRSPTSIPSPAYIAGAYAERGRKVVNAFMMSSDEYNELHFECRKKSTSAEFLGGLKSLESAEQKAKINLFNHKITLHNKETLRRRRINA